MVFPVTGKNRVILGLELVEITILDNGKFGIVAADEVEIVRSESRLFQTAKTRINIYTHRMQTSKA